MCLLTLTSDIFLGRGDGAELKIHVSKGQRHSISGSEVLYCDKLHCVK